MKASRRLLPRAIAAAAALIFTAAGASAQEYVSCGPDHRIGFTTNDNAFWGTLVTVDGQLGWSGCAYKNGVGIPLTDINDWTDLSKVAGKSVRIFHGIGNVCSAGQFLIFNELTGDVLIVHSD